MFCKLVVIGLQYSEFSKLLVEKTYNDGLFMFNLTLHQFHFIELIIDTIWSCEQFCIDCCERLLIIQLFCNRTTTMMHDLITTGTVGKKIIVSATRLELGFSFPCRRASTAGCTKALKHFTGVYPTNFLCIGDRVPNKTKVTGYRRFHGLTQC